MRLVNGRAPFKRNRLACPRAGMAGPGEIRDCAHRASAAQSIDSVTQLSGADARAARRDNATQRRQGPSGSTVLSISDHHQRDDEPK